MMTSVGKEEEEKVGKCFSRGEREKRKSWKTEKSKIRWEGNVVYGCWTENFIFSLWKRVGGLIQGGCNFVIQKRFQYYINDDSHSLRSLAIDCQNKHQHRLSVFHSLSREGKGRISVFPDFHTKKKASEEEKKISRPFSSHSFVEASAIATNENSKAFVLQTENVSLIVCKEAKKIILGKVKI